MAIFSRSSISTVICDRHHTASIRGNVVPPRASRGRFARRPRQVTLAPALEHRCDLLVEHALKALTAGALHGADRQQQLRTARVHTSFHVPRGVGAHARGCGRAVYVHARAHPARKFHRHAQLDVRHGDRAVRAVPLDGHPVGRDRLGRAVDRLHQLCHPLRPRVDGRLGVHHTQREAFRRRALDAHHVDRAHDGTREGQRRRYFPETVPLRRRRLWARQSATT
eukprot:5577559-Prymnesium_polylepis.1